MLPDKQTLVERKLLMNFLPLKLTYWWPRKENTVETYRDQGGKIPNLLWRSNLFITSSRTRHVLDNVKVIKLFTTDNKLNVKVYCCSYCFNDVLVLGRHF